MGPKANDPAITAEMAKEIFHYDDATGNLIRKKDLGGRFGRVGDIAGFTTPDGYRKVAIRQHVVMAHRLIWLIVTGEWPSDEIDHRDCDKGNNRFDNLRVASRRQNVINRAFKKNGLPKGARYMPSGRIQVRIRAEDKVRYLGTFETPEQAAAAYAEAASRLHGEFANSGAF